jgi:hypothetical protein
VTPCGLANGRRLEDDIKMDFKSVGWDFVDYIYVRVISSGELL